MSESKSEYPMGVVTPGVNGGAPAYSVQTGYQHPSQTSGYQTSSPPPQEVEHNETRQEHDDEKPSGAGDVQTKHLNLDFEECFFESKGTQTVPQIYTFTGLMYKYTKLVVYHFFVLVFGILLAFIWAIINGLMAFIHTWVYSPALKLTVFWILAMSPLVTAPLQAIWTPLVDSTARIFRQIQVKASLDGSFAQRLTGQGQMQTV